MKKKIDTRAAPAVAASLGLGLAVISCGGSAGPSAWLKTGAAADLNAVSIALGTESVPGSMRVYYTAPAGAAAPATLCVAAKVDSCAVVGATFERGEPVTISGNVPTYRSLHDVDATATPWVTVHTIDASGKALTHNFQLVLKTAAGGTTPPAHPDEPPPPPPPPVEDTTCSDLVKNPQQTPLYTNPSKVALTKVEREMVCYTLRVRVLRAGQSPMVVDPTLMRNARAWAAANARDHAPNRHSGQNVAENAFHTVPTARDAVDGWEASPGHYQNIVGPYTKIGVGVAWEDDGQGIPHWIEQFIW